MASLSTHFIKDVANAKSKKDVMIVGEKYRFTVLSERMIRLEYSENGIFEDRPTQLVLFRDFERPFFNVHESSSTLEIKTKYFTLTYSKNKPFEGSKLLPGDNLKISLNNSDRVWYYNHPEVRNFGGANISLDDFAGSLKLRNGLYSMDGFVSIDDSESYVLTENETFEPRSEKVKDIYVIMYRKDFGLCLKDYLELTGMPTLIPRYALGNWWSKNEKYNLDGIKELVNHFEEEKIPLSVIVLEDKWHNNTEKFYFDKEVFPNPSELVKYLHEKGIRLGLTIDPSSNILPSDPNYNTIASGLGITTSSGISLVPLNMKKLGMYFKLYVNPLENLGIDFFNINYYNEKDIHNLWLLDHYHFAKSDSEEKKRGMIMTRNPLIAPHRYPVLSSGKTKVNWETLNILPFYNASSSNIGLSWWSHPIGGYYGGIEDSELYMRYIQFATYSPIFRLSSKEGKYYKREPWSWDIQKLSVIKEYMELRHRLIPYLYSESFIYSKTGAPLVQPLYYKYPEIYDDPAHINEYFFGSQLLVSPITKKKDLVMNRVVQRLFIPKGMWYDFKTGKKFPGGNYYVSFFKDEDYPVFCKAGGIIPLSNNINSTGVPTDLEIHVFPGQSNNYKLYEDDGISNLYKEGYYLLTLIDYNYRANNYTLIIRPLEGKSGIIPEKRNYKIRFRNTKEAEDVIVYVNDKKVEINSYVENTDFVLEIKDVPTIGQLTINCKGKDIEIDAVRLINEEIEGIINDLEIETSLKEKIDEILFSYNTIKKKRIEIRKLKRKGLEPKFVKMFIKLLEYINEI